ncbi:DUF2268 domain-containing protein [Nocardiopsis sp. NRRL B-16309]|uniref:DUF2268 domain-containing protein n=1 Tax=Nocardiopsis sp. NRRL B-16309 TaxID=1519494 RepID=UPI0006AE91A6|nr:DUF2268 domain-containing putative Zn-dependent protease [Nocardiopsis sp. NRRL B-16309]KOX17326.1 peptidase [Nocardiopsis sp. NRRL B-16309]
MTITVPDTLSAMRGILRAPAADRPGLLRSMLEPVRSMYRHAPGEVDPVDMHLRSAGFSLDRDEGTCLEALETLAKADALGRIRRALDDGLAVLREGTPGLAVPDITVLLVLGDPADAVFTGPSLGVTGFGGISGSILITLWPFPENVARLEATAVHELHHNVRFAPGGAVWDPATVTVGDHVVSEGLADAFARELYGDDLGRTRIGVPHLHDDAVFARVVSGLGVTGMENFASWVLGDAIARNVGGTPVGLPTGAGYSAGNRLADAYLAATGRTAAQAVHADGAAVVSTALDRLGLPWSG